jgi:hypothetical protein
MKPIVFVFSHDVIFDGVKQESSLLAIRMRDEQGNGLFDEFVFDEDYLTKFRELFFDARAAMDFILSKYMKEVPVDVLYSEAKDFSKERDYEVFLSMPDHWNFHLSSPLNSKIKEFLIAYILWRWLETKDTGRAIIYKSRSESVDEEIKRMLNAFTKPAERPHYWY